MKLRILAVLVLGVIAAAAWNYLRPIPAVAASGSVLASEVISGTLPSIPWPTRGSAAVGVQSLGFIASSGNEQAIPAASVTKVMTALVILEDKPLKASESGPTITITDADVQSYQAGVANKESVALVQSGEQITELQALQGLSLIHI